MARHINIQYIVVTFHKIKYRKHSESLEYHKVSFLSNSSDYCVHITLKIAAVSFKHRETNSFDIFLNFLYS
jgi:hypothetical protein